MLWYCSVPSDPGSALTSCLFSEMAVIALGPKGLDELYELTLLWQQQRTAENHRGDRHYQPVISQSY